MNFMCNYDNDFVFDDGINTYTIKGDFETGYSVCVDGRKLYSNQHLECCIMWIWNF